MKQELIYNILPIKAYEIELKCFYASHFILGRIFALWNKKKKAIKVSKDYFLKIKHLKKPALWVILKELQDKNIITITRINNNNNVMIIDFTDDFIKNYVNAEIEAETEAEGIDEIDTEDIEEQDLKNIFDNLISENKLIHMNGIYFYNKQLVKTKQINMYPLFFQISYKNPFHRLPSTQF